MKRILVTGATGFIGRQSLDPLIRLGYEVHGITEDVSPRHPEGVRWHCENLFDNARVDELVGSIKPSHLLHFAWFAKPGEYWMSFENLRWVQASVALLHSFVKHGGQRFVGAGTCAEYDWRYARCQENATPLASKTLYAVSKRAFSDVLQAVADNTSLSSAWGRIFMLYGPHEHPKRLVPAVVLPLLEGRPADCTAGRQVRDLLHVSDVGRAFAALVDSEVTGAVNIASGNPVAIREVVEKAAAIIGRKDLLRLGALETPADDPAQLVASVHRLTNEVNWRPQIGLDEGLAQTVEWWRGQTLQRGTK